MPQIVKANQAKRGRGYKVEMVAEQDLYYGLLRMYQAYSGSMPFELNVYRSLDEALQWVNQPLDE